MFKEILKGQTIILQKLSQIMESQINMSMEHSNSPNTNVINNGNNSFSRKFKDMFPTTNNKEILNVEDSLNDHDFYHYVVS